MTPDQQKELVPKTSQNLYLRDHLANERTFLAWIRTSLGIMAFGFVVVKFALFVRQLSYAIQKPVPYSNNGKSTLFGIFLVGFGTLIGLLAFLRFKMIERQLSDPHYEPSLLLPAILTFSVLLVGIILVIYLTLTA